VAGTGSQTGNSVISGRIVTSDSTQPVAGVWVYLRPEGWTSGDSADPDALQAVRTDSTGNYRFSQAPRGRYRIEARNDGQGWSRTLDASSAAATLAAGALQGLGTLRVELDPSDTILGGKLQIYGLDRSIAIPAASDHDFYLAFDSLPPGLHTVRIWSHGKVVADAPVRIHPGGSDTLDYEELDLPPGGPRDDD